MVKEMPRLWSRAPIVRPPGPPPMMAILGGLEGMLCGWDFCATMLFQLGTVNTALESCRCLNIVVEGIRCLDWRLEMGTLLFHEEGKEMIIYTLCQSQTYLA